KRQGLNVEKQVFRDAAGEAAGLDRGADADDLVRVDALVRLLAVEHRLDRLDDGRHPGLATDEDHLVDLGRLQPGVLERGLDRLSGLLDEVADEVLELGPGQRHDEVLGPGRSGGAVAEGWCGPDASGVMYGRLISVDDVDDSSIFAFSAASLRRCRACGSFERS